MAGLYKLLFAKCLITKTKIISKCKRAKKYTKTDVYRMLGKRPN